MSPSKKNKWYGLKEQMVRAKKTNGTGFEKEQKVRKKEHHIDTCFFSRYNQR